MHLDSWMGSTSAGFFTITSGVEWSSKTEQIWVGHVRQFEIVTGVGIVFDEGIFAFLVSTLPIFPTNFLFFDRLRKYG